MKDISGVDYHSDTSRISKSGLDLINTSPRHYFAAKLDKNRPEHRDTKDFRIGRLVHTAILEPERFELDYVLAPETNKRTKEGKAEYQHFLERNKGMEVLDSSEYNLANTIAMHVRGHEIAGRILSHPGVAEKTFYWKDRHTGAMCKCRPDYLREDGIVVDVKTTTSASPDDFKRSFYNYRYHVQDAFYSDGLLANGVKVRGFVFIAVEKTPPYNIVIYSCCLDSKALGRKEYIRNLRTYMKCLDTGEWPGYADKILEIKLPNYLKNN